MIISSSHFLELIQSKKKLSSTIVPELIHRLIRETLNSNTYTHFPSGDDIFVPGFDGYVKANKIKNRFVPFGNSFFEIGTNTNCYKSFSKINSDYVKRKNDGLFLNKHEYTYVAVTTSILNSSKKEAVNLKYDSENVFKNVVIIDAVDITNWMEEHIDICIWFLQSFGEKIDDYGITVLNDEWNRISLCTTPNLNCSIFKIGNESNSEKLIKDLLEIKSNRIITISSKHYGKEYAFIFCVASLFDSNNSDLIERTIIVNSQPAMNYISAFCHGKIVLVNFNCLDDRFAIELNNTYVFFDSLFGDDIKLEMFQQKDFEKEVEKMGFSTFEAHKISFTIDYNVLALRRLLTKIPSIKIPQWCRNNNKNELIPLLLLGEINMSDECSRDFIAHIIGNDLDNYTETLNLWSEISESPILKFENTYRICSRKECFDFLQIDIFSSKLKRIEEKLILTFNNIINSKCRYRTIENIINGFIILSEKNKKNQLHFDSFVNQVFSKLYDNYELSLEMSDYFYILCELSPVSFLSFLERSLSTYSDNFLNLIKSSNSKSILKKSYIHNIIYALEVTLKIDVTCITGLKALLDIYYFIDDKIIFDEVIKYLSPISTMIGICAISLPQKIDFFFNYVLTKDDEKTRSVVKKLYIGGDNSIAIANSYSFRSFLKKEIIVTYQEIFEMRAKAFTWIIEHTQNSNDLIETIQKTLESIHTSPIGDVKCQLNIIKEKIKNENDETKALAIMKMLKTRESILKFPDWQGLLDYVNFFDEIIAEIEPIDDYIKNKYLLIYDDYPLLNPPSLNDSEWHEKSSLLRKEAKGKQLSFLIEKYGQRILTRLINDCKNSPGVIWEIIYNYSTNHLRDVRRIIKNNSSCGLRIYLRCLTENELRKCFKLFSNESIFIQNLPYSKTTYLWIDGNSKEKEYWENQSFNYNSNEDFEYLFNKFIIFAPLELVTTCAYFADFDYEHSINILKAIANLISKDAKHQLKNYEIDSIQVFVKKMDNKYYTEELSFIEFELLSVLKGVIGDYPIGIKRFFWNNPEQFGNLLVQLYEHKNSLKNTSMGYMLLQSAIMPIGEECYIPKDYLIQKKSDLKLWVSKVLKCGESKTNDVMKLLKSSVINTLTSCPKNFADTIWPIKEIADLLEVIASSNYDDKNDVAEIFSIGYKNRRNIRNVSDGTYEYQLSEEFKKYQEYYQFTHPITSKALEFISNGYNYTANKDRQKAIVGDI